MLPAYATVVCAIYRLANPFRATGKYELCVVDMHRGWMNVNVFH